MADDLNDEILRRILIFACESCIPLSSAALPRPQARHLMPTAYTSSRVSQRWKSIVYATPTLWVTRLVFGSYPPDDDGPSVALSLDCYQQWVDQSEGSLLDIHFEDFYTASTFGQPKALMGKILDMINPYMHLWRTLNAINLPSSMMRGLIYHISQAKSLENLRSVSFAPFSSEEAIDHKLGAWSTMTNLSLLVVKELRDELSTVLPFENLLELEIDISTHQHHSTWRNLFTILLQAPRLNRLVVVAPHLSGVERDSLDFSNSSVTAVGSEHVLMGRLKRIELSLELSDAIMLLTSLGLPSLRHLKLTSICASPHRIDIPWPQSPFLLPILQNLTLQHISINHAITFFSCFNCPELHRLTIVAAVNNMESSPRTLRESMLNQFLHKTYKLVSSTTSSLTSLFKNQALAVLQSNYRYFTSELPNLEHLRLVATDRQSDKAFISEVEMQNLVSLDVQSYHALRNHKDLVSGMEKTPTMEFLDPVRLSSLQELKVDSLEQAYLLRHFSTGGSKSPIHLYIRDLHKDVCQNWKRFCTSEQMTLSCLTGLTLHVRCEWWSSSLTSAVHSPKFFEHCVNLTSLTLIFDVAAGTGMSILDSLVDSRLAPKSCIQLPKLTELSLKFWDNRSILPIEKFISFRERTGHPITTLIIYPLDNLSKIDVALLRSIVPNLTTG